MTSLTIGSVTLDAPFCQASLAGYSDAAMRRLAREYGCPYTINEVVLDRLVGVRGKRMRRMLTIAPDEHPVGGQLMGGEPEQFAEAADRLVGLGYDAIDINFGCPVPKVLGRCRGGYLLSVPEQAREIVRRVYDAVGGRVPVTVKMRRGLDDTPASERAFFVVLDAAFEIGVASVTVHGRTVKQRYIGPSDWGFIAKVKRHVGGRTILGSGDLFTAEDCVRMLHETGVDGCSIARGAIGNPFIFRELRALLGGACGLGRRVGAGAAQSQPGAAVLHQGAAVLHQGAAGLPPPSIAEQRQAIERHFALMGELYGEADARLRFVKFGVRYSELHPCGADVKMAFVAARTAEDWQALLERWYGDEANYPPVTRRSRPESLIAAGATWEREREG